MQLRVVTDQPWDVAADVLAVPVAPDPAFDGPLGELDRRCGGELARARRVRRADRQALRDRDRRPPATCPAGRLLAVGAGPAAELDRETVVRLGRDGRAAARRPPGPDARRSGSATSPAPLDGGAAAVAELLVRGVVEGSFDPATIYRADAGGVPPVLDELDPRRARAPTRPPSARAAERGAIIGEGTNLTRRLANRAANDVSPEVLADEARAIAAEHGLWIDVIDEVRAAELGMGMFLAVGRGSANPPRMIVAPLRRGRARRTPSAATSPSSARASASTRAASPSSRPTGWRR